MEPVAPPLQLDDDADVVSGEMPADEEWPKHKPKTA
jgi:hypothetical protein